MKSSRAFVNYGAVKKSTSRINNPLCFIDSKREFDMVDCSVSQYGRPWSRDRAVDV